MRRRAVIAFALYAVVTAAFLATTPSDRLAFHTPYNHFALLAESWLHGRLDLGGPPPDYTGNNDFAVHHGKNFVSFPPFPALLILPVVKLAGSAERVRDGQFFLWFAGVGPAVLYLALDKLSRAGRSRRGSAANVALALLFAFGSVYWFTAVQGTVWFAAHVVGVALATVYLYACIGGDHPLLAGASIGLAFATRTPLGFAFPLFLYEAARASRLEADGRAGTDRAGALARRLLQFAVPAAGLLSVLLWHNRQRFGDPLEFGHRFLAIGWRARIDKYGLFSFHYLGRNLAVLLTGLPFTGTTGAPFQINAHGLALWITTPAYLWVFGPKRAGGLYWALGATALAVAVPSLLYQNTGWIQFGYRFSNDFAPFLFAMIAVGGRRLSIPFWIAAAAGVAVNAFGAVTFQRAGFERFYYVDRTQKVIHQPD